jgi:hypothetical protein
MVISLRMLSFERTRFMIGDEVYEGLASVISSSFVVAVCSRA